MLSWVLLLREVSSRCKKFRQGKDPNGHRESPIRLSTSSHIKELYRTMLCDKLYQDVRKSDAPPRLRRCGPRIGRRRPGRQPTTRGSGTGDCHFGSSAREAAAAGGAAPAGALRQRRLKARRASRRAAAFRLQHCRQTRRRRLARARASLEHRPAGRPVAVPSRGDIGCRGPSGPRDWRR